MRMLIAKLAVTAAVLSLAVPDITLAQSYHSSAAARRHAVSCHKARRRRANNGTAIGGVGGALAGAAIGHSVAGTLIGGAAGAVIGHTVADRRKGDC